MVLAVTLSPNLFTRDLGHDGSEYIATWFRDFEDVFHAAVGCFYPTGMVSNTCKKIRTRLLSK